MSRASSIDKLPETVRAEIGRLRGQGYTIDQILTFLRGMGEVTEPPSRSALGRHVHGLDKIGEKMRRSRDVAVALVRELGDAEESHTARLNIELLHGAILDLFMKNADGEEVNASGAEALAGDPEGAMMLAKALDHLGRASKSNVDVIAAAEKRAAERATKAAAASVDGVARARGITGDTVAAIKAAIFGVAA